MHNTLPAGGGLTEFITGVRQRRDAETEEIVRAARMLITKCTGRVWWPAETSAITP